MASINVLYQIQSKSCVRSAPVLTEAAIGESTEVAAASAIMRIYADAESVTYTGRGWLVMYRPHEQIPSIRQSLGLSSRLPFNCPRLD